MFLGNHEVVSVPGSMLVVSSLYWEGFCFSGRYSGCWFRLLVPVVGSGCWFRLLVLVVGSLYWEEFCFSGRIVGSLFLVPCSTGSDMFQKGYGGGDPPAFAVGAHCLIPYENKNPIRRIGELFLYTDCVERF